MLLNDVKIDVVKLLKNTEFKYSWLTFFVGKKLKIFESEEIIEYAIEQLEKTEESIYPFVLEVAQYYGSNKIDDSEFSNSLKKLIKATTPDDLKSKEKKDIEVRKLRYFILNQIFNLNLKYDALLNALRDVYVLFDGPADMAQLVQFLPLEQGSRKIFTEEECHKSRHFRLQKFLDHEKRILRKERA